MTKIADRVTRMAPSETLAMTQKSQELKAQGFDVISLSIGEPDFDTPEAIKNKAKEAIDKNFTHYPPVPGYQDLRDAVVAKLKRDNNLEYTAGQIIVSNGAKHSITNALLALVNPGDEVIIPSPYWVSYPEMVKLADGIPVFVQASIDTDFKVTARQIEAAITPKTRVLLINSPSNPTGSVYTKEELKNIAEMLAKYPDITIISDEIYELILFEGVHESIAQFPEIKDRVVIVNGVSKGFAMTGWRIGYTASNSAIAGAMNKIQGQMTSAASSIAQKAATAAELQDPKSDKDLVMMVKTFKERRDNLLQLLAEIPGVKTTTPPGAFYVFMNIAQLIGKKFDKYTISSGAAMADYLLDTAHVALVGGDAFGDPNCIRISYATDMETLKEAVRRIKEAVAKLS